MFWGECILTTTYLINYTPLEVLFVKSPYEIIFGRQPSHEHLRVFGLLCYVMNNPRKKDKFGDRIRKCIFLRYPLGRKAGRYMKWKHKNYLFLQM